MVTLGFYSNLGSGPVFGFEVGGAGRVVSDLNCGEERLSPMLFQVCNILGDQFLDLSSHQSAVHEYSSQFLKRTLLPSNLNGSSVRSLIASGRIRCSSLRRRLERVSTVSSSRIATAV